LLQSICNRKTVVLNLTSIASSQALTTSPKDGHQSQGEVSMNTTHIKRFVVTAVVVATTSGGVALAAVHSSPASAHWTPNDCIHLNHGDYNACNVGKSGSGNQPYHR